MSVVVGEEQKHLVARCGQVSTAGCRRLFAAHLRCVLSRFVLKCRSLGVRLLDGDSGTPTPLGDDKGRVRIVDPDTKEVNNAVVTGPSMLRTTLLHGIARLPCGARASPGDAGVATFQFVVTHLETDSGSGNTRFVRLGAFVNGGAFDVAVGAPEQLQAALLQPLLRTAAEAALPKPKGSE